MRRGASAPAASRQREEWGVSDFENLQNLDDRELRDVARAALEAHNGIDADYITVNVIDGAVTLEGRVGTDYEQRVAERVLTDVVGFEAVTNNLVVQAIHRAESPMDIHEHLADEERTEGLLLGDRAVPLSPEAEMLEEDLDARLSGTSDMGRAIADGTPWIPPESATQEGLDGAAGEDH
jgi:hypothetical protein